ncbi:MAG TPA: hypothetical protein VIW73_11975 [Candidatus Cybelea sp.]
MILAAAVAAALAAPSRELLIQRWLRADTTHTVARLRSGPPAARNAAAPDLQALAQTELATPGRYRLAQPVATPKPWWSRIWRWIADRWQKFWNGLFSRVRVGREAAASVGDLLLAIVALILLVTIVRLVRNIQITRAAAANMRTEPLGDAPSPAELYQQACAAANRGDYGAAALVLFAATVALLDNKGAVVASRSATVGDLRRQVRARDTNLVDPFDAVAAPFVQRAYAERPIGEPQWNRARFAYQELLATA